MLHHKAIEKLATAFTDALYDVDPEESAYTSYFRAINEEIVEIPGTMVFIKSKLSLSISHDRKGRHEYTNTLTQRPLIYPQSPMMIQTGQQQEQKGPGLFSKLLSRRSRGTENEK